MYTLYYSPGRSSLGPHIALEEIAVPYRAERVPIDHGTSAEGITAPEYLAINPKGRVPALVVAGKTLTEALAILTYLARAHPEAGLLPSDAEAEARCLEWMGWLSTTVHAIAFAQVVRPQRFVDEAKDWPAVVGKGRRNVAAAFTQIEAQLEGRNWAVGERYSIVDAYLLFYYLSGMSAGAPMADLYPAWSRVAANALARPAVRRVLEQEGLGAAVYKSKSAS